MNAVVNGEAAVTAVDLEETLSARLLIRQLRRPYPHRFKHPLAPPDRLPLWVIFSSA